MVINRCIWATVNIWYIAPSHIFLKSVLSFFRFWYVSKCYRFLKSVVSLSEPQLNFKKIRILLSINLNIGCSPCIYIYMYIYILCNINICIYISNIYTYIIPSSSEYIIYPSSTYLDHLLDLPETEKVLPTMKTDTDNFAQ